MELPHIESLQIRDCLPSAYNIVSPTSKQSGRKLVTSGLISFMRRPISLSHAFGPDVSQCDGSKQGSNATRQLPISEGEYYEPAASVVPSYVISSTLRPGFQGSTSTLYPNASAQKSCISLASNSKPEFRCVSDIQSRTAYNGEVKSIQEDAVEEIGQAAANAMSEVCFANSESLDFYNVPPISFMLLGIGPLFTLLLVEWIGCLYISFFSEPFLVGGVGHRTAVHHSESVVDERQPVIALSVSLSESMLPRSVPKSGVLLVKKGSKFIKIVEISAVLESKQRADYKSMLGENECKDVEWSDCATYFYHMQKVYTKLAQLWRDFNAALNQDPNVRESAEWCYINRLVSCRYLYGKFQVAVESDYCGSRDATATEMQDPSILKEVCETVIWLAKKTGMLYTDLRHPNVRITPATADTTRQLWLIDYDDMALLDAVPCCGRPLSAAVFKNTYLTNEIFKGNRALQKVLTECCDQDVCHNCRDSDV